MYQSFLDSYSFSVLGDSFQPDRDDEPPFYSTSAGPQSVLDVNVPGVNDRIANLKAAEVAFRAEVSSKKELRRNIAHGENSQYITAPRKLVAGSIRQVSKISVQLCCGGGLQDVRRLLDDKMGGNVVITRIHAEDDSGESNKSIKMHLLALNYKGRRALARMFIAPNVENLSNEKYFERGEEVAVDTLVSKMQSQQRGNFFMKIDQAQIGEHCLIQPVCLDPPFVPLHCDPLMKICENCKQTNCSLLCQACKGVMYCNKACQKMHWRNSHRQLCAPYRKEDETPCMENTRNGNDMIEMQANWETNNFKKSLEKENPQWRSLSHSELEQKFVEYLKRVGGSYVENLIKEEERKKLRAKLKSRTRNSRRR